VRGGGFGVGRHGLVEEVRELLQSSILLLSSIGEIFWCCRAIFVSSWGASDLDDLVDHHHHEGHHEASEKLGVGEGRTPGAR